MNDDRRALSTVFLGLHGWQNADRCFLAGDASDRTYDRLTNQHSRAVLMDSPPGKGDDPRIFATVAAHLKEMGLSVPNVLAQDFEAGFLLLEDFGDARFAQILQNGLASEDLLYAAATDALVLLQSSPTMTGLPDLSADDWADAAMMAFDWYAYGIRGVAPESGAIKEALAASIRTHANGPRVMIHRDFHAENLMWLPDRIGERRVGILDFQLLQLGHPVYDLVSLLQDARRDVGADTVAATKQRFVARSGMPNGTFAAAFAVIGVQRALRIIGIFARLCMIAEKAHYLQLIPRVWQHLQENLAHPALAEVDRLCRPLLPAPTEKNLSILQEKSGKLLE